MVLVGRRGPRSSPTGELTATPASRPLPTWRAAVVDWLPVALVLLPFLVIAAVSIDDLGNRYLPAQDYALIELRTRDVGLHRVLTGLYSRDGWSHPGPALFYALALPYRLTGSSHFGLALGALLINAIAVVGMGVVARRHGGTSLLLCTMLVCAVLVRALGANFVRDPWVCFVTVLPFALAVLLSYAAFSGDAWALPVTAAVSSFVAQTHVGYVVLAVPLIAWGAVGLLGRARRTGASRSAGVAVLATAAVLVLAWSPPVADEVLHDEGNLSRIVDWFGAQGDEAHSLPEGARVVTAQLRVDAGLDHGEGGGRTRCRDHVPALGAGAAAVAAVRGSGTGGVAPPVETGAPAGADGHRGPRRRRRGRRPHARRRLRLPAPVDVGRRRPPGPGDGVDGLARRAGALAWCRSGLVPLGLGAIAVLSVVTTADAVGTGAPQAHDARVLRALVPPVREAVEDGDGEVVVRAVSPIGDHLEPGVVLALVRAGVPARVDRDPIRRYGGHRVAGRRPPRAVLLIAGDDAIYELSRRRDLRLVGYWGEVPLDEAKRWDRRLASRASALADTRQRGTIDGDEFTDRMGLPPRASGRGEPPSPSSSTNRARPEARRSSTPPVTSGHADPRSGVDLRAQTPEDR